MVRFVPINAIAKRNIHDQYDFINGKSMDDLHYLFIPILGSSVSILTWLNFRGMTIASQMRDITQRFKACDQPEQGGKLIDAGELDQIEVFLSRFKMNTFANRTTISGAIAFCFFFASWTILQVVKWGPDFESYFQHFMLGALALGAILHIVAVLVSAGELRRGTITLGREVEGAIDHLKAHSPNSKPNIEQFNKISRLAKASKKFWTWPLW